MVAIIMIMAVCEISGHDCHSFERCHPRYWIASSPLFFSIVFRHHSKACRWLTRGHSFSVCLIFQLRCREQLFTCLDQVSTIPIVYVWRFDFAFTCLQKDIVLCKRERRVNPAEETPHLLCTLTAALRSRRRRWWPCCKTDACPDTLMEGL